jgi:hypothetical protein
MTRSEAEKLIGSRVQAWTSMNGVYCGMLEEVIPSRPWRGVVRIDGILSPPVTFEFGRRPRRGFRVGETIEVGGVNISPTEAEGAGTVVGVDGGMLTVDFDGEPHEFAGLALDDLALAYAITVHKAQGSQFRSIVMPVVPSRLLDRSLIYTALTRASERVVLAGQRDVLEKAVTAMPAAGRRETGFR